MSILQNLRRHRRLVWHRLGDWVLVALMTGVAFLLDLAPAFNRQFSLTDTTIQYPMSKKSTVPSAALFVISTIVPALILTSIAVGVRRCAYEVHQALLGLGIALSSTSLFIHIFKNFIGRPRPDFLDRCQPPSGATDPFMALSTISVCTQTNAKILADGMKSFPSGHSAYSFAGLGFLSFYIAGKLRIFDERGFVYKPLLALLPLLGAALVAISRVCDYRHHWEDVTLGGAAGLFLAYYAYRMFFPPLTHSRTGFAFPVNRQPGPVSSEERPLNNSSNWRIEEGNSSNIPLKYRNSNGSSNGSGNLERDGTIDEKMNEEEAAVSHRMATLS